MRLACFAAWSFAGRLTRAALIQPAAKISRAVSAENQVVRVAYHAAEVALP